MKILCFFKKLLNKKWFAKIIENAETLVFILYVIIFIPVLLQLISSNDVAEVQNKFAQMNLGEISVEEFINLKFEFLLIVTVIALFGFIIISIFRSWDKLTGTIKIKNKNWQKIIDNKEENKEDYKFYRALLEKFDNNKKKTLQYLRKNHQNNHNLFEKIEDYNCYNHEKFQTEESAIFNKELSKWIYDFNSLFKGYILSFIFWFTYLISPLLFFIIFAIHISIAFILKLTFKQIKKTALYANIEYWKNSKEDDLYQNYLKYYNNNEKRAISQLAKEFPEYNELDIIEERIIPY